ncbi:MAG: biopolymer transporter ExbD [Chitinispirillaceae bacterium]|nr:biopolymer transporter ExbD [Chitinispirillaceae bacterium]
MKSLFLSRSEPLSQQAEDNEIDIAPVMNMFIILVTFLISMVVFTHVAVLELSVPPNVSAGLSQSKGKPRVRLTVRIGTDYAGIVIGDRLLDSLPVESGNLPLERLAECLLLRREETAVRDEVIVASRDEIDFQQVVRVMDLCRETGFSKIGLSSATVDPTAGR